MKRKDDLEEDLREAADYMSWLLKAFYEKGFDKGMKFHEVSGLADETVAMQRKKKKKKATTVKPILQTNYGKLLIAQSYLDHLAKKKKRKRKKSRDEKPQSKSS